MKQQTTAIDLSDVLHGDLMSVRVHQRRTSLSDGSEGNLVSFRMVDTGENSIHAQGNFCLSGSCVVHEQMEMNSKVTIRMDGIYIPSGSRKIELLEIVPHDDGLYMMRVEMSNGDVLTCLMDSPPMYFGSWILPNRRHMDFQSIQRVDQFPQWDDKEGIIMFSTVDLL